jgi:hypothetical protein
MSRLGEGSAGFSDSIGAGCGIGWRRCPESGERGIGQGQIGRLDIENLLIVEEDARGDVRGNESYVVWTLSIEDAVPAFVAEVGEGAAEGSRVFWRVPNRPPDEGLSVAVFPERKMVTIPPGGGVASGFWQGNVAGHGMEALSGLEIGEEHGSLQLAKRVLVDDAPVRAEYGGGTG